MVDVSMSWLVLGFGTLCALGVLLCAYHLRKYRAHSKMATQVASRSDAEKIAELADKSLNNVLKAFVLALSPGLFIVIALLFGFNVAVGGLVLLVPRALLDLVDDRILRNRRTSLSRRIDHRFTDQTTAT